MVDQSVRERYFEWLKAYFSNPEETGLGLAAELGRELVQAGAQAEDIVVMHEEGITRLAQAFPDLDFVQATHLLTAPLIELLTVHSQEFRVRLEAHQQVEQALEHAAQEWRDTFDTMNDIVTIHDNQFRIIRANWAAAQAFGYGSPADLIGKPCYEVFHDRNSPIENCPLHRTQQSGKMETFENWEPSIGRSLQIITNPIFDAAGNMTRVVHVMRDITAHKKAEEEMRRRVDELRVLHAVASAGAEAISEDELIDKVTQIINETLYPDNIGVLLLDETAGVLRVHPSYRGVNEKAKEIKVALRQGVAGTVAARGEPWRVPDVRAEPLYIDVNPEMGSELCVPLKAGDRVIGVINAESSKEDFFTAYDERLLVTVAGQLSTALGRVHLFEQTRRQAAEEAALLTAAQALSSLHLDEILETIARQVRDLLKADGSRIHLLAPDGETLNCAVALHERAEATRSVKLALGEGITGRIALTGIPEIINQSLNDPDVIQVPGTPVEPEAMALAPLKIREEVIGVMTVTRLGEDFPFTQEDLTFLMAFANLVVAAIQNARLFENISQTLEREKRFNEIAHALSGTLDLPSILGDVVRLAVELLEADAGALGLVAPDGQTITYPYLFNLPDELSLKPAPKDTGLAWHIVETGEMVLLADYATHPRALLNWVEAGVHSFLGIPVEAHDERIGALGLFSLNSERHFTEREGIMVEAVGQQAGIAIQNARMYQAALKSAQRSNALHWASQEMVRVTQDPEQVYLAVHQAAEKIMPCEAFVITLWDEVQQNIHAVYMVDRGGRSTPFRIPPESGLSGTVISSGQSLLIDDYDFSTSSVNVVHYGDPEHVRSILAVPMRIGEKIQGMVSVQSYQPFAYTRDDQPLLEMLAAHAAVALENTRLFAETRRRAGELEVLSRVSAALRIATSRREMAPVVLDQMLDLLQADGAALIRLDSARGDAVIEIVRGAWFDGEGVHLSLEGSVTGMVTTSGEPYVSANAPEDPKILRRDLLGEIAAIVCLPLMVQEQPIGALWVGRCKTESSPRPEFTGAEVHLLMAIADMAANAFQRAELYEETQRQVERLAALHNIDMTITASVDLDLTLKVLMGHVKTQLGVDASAVFLLNPFTQTLQFSAGQGFVRNLFKRVRIRVGDGFIGRVALERKLVAIPDLGEADDQVETYGRLIGEGFATYFGVPLIAKGQVKGVLAVFHRDQFYPKPKWHEYLQAMATQAAIAIDNAQLFTELHQSNLELILAYDATLEGWVRALELRSKETEGHTQQLTEWTIQLARMMGINDSTLVHIRRGALLHDLGKIGVPDQILLKPGPLTEEEWAIMRQHPDFAYDLLSQISFLRPALDIPHCHHEKWDGTGYPQGLEKEHIPLAARIFSVVDVWDALLSDRPYRKAWSHREALAYIRSQSGAHFDPRVVEAFLQIADSPLG